ncbi:hypothetical protein L249_4805 [Ophiocordyceps polyrhachis-furcata BCC 54312]|uniref:Major facilitator superfamily (MFS) profile domain-containing protein n=1 Tax=Ophiocordyceps polyrhachis-furcata BCC 54312 TaxID=1330021 RepID=A0A367L2X5_9HYPO|nr:hypothetical protein L249_4805 [Ophiocordyceps polyrhachis-furcata BCC 54312]
MAIRPPKTLHTMPRNNSNDDTATTALLLPPKHDDDDDDDERTVIAKQVSFTKLALIMTTAWSGVFLSALDSTIIATLSAPIASEFRSLSLFSWLATGYFIATAACQPLSGRLTDIFGRGPGLVFCNVVFAGGNLVCGLASNQYVMIVGRVVAGVGGGGLLSIATFVASDLVPLRQRGLVGGIGNLWFGTGCMLGGVLGGLLNDYTSLGWRLAFLIQVPPSILSAMAVPLLVQVPPKQSDRSHLARIDFLGVFLTSSFLLLLVFGLNAGGNLTPWAHPLPISCLLLSLVLFITFLWWESRARQPMLPVKLLLHRTVFFASITSLLVAMLANTAIFYVPLYLQMIMGETATSAGLRTLSSPVGMVCGALCGGYLMRRTGKFVGLAIASVVMLVVGAFLLCLQSRHTPAALTTAAFFFIGGGYSAVLSTTQIACIAAVDHSQQAVVTSITFLARSLGSTAGITIVSALYQNTLDTQLWSRFRHEPDAAAIISRLRDDITQLRNVPPAWRSGVVASFSAAFRCVWLTVFAWALLALVFVSLIKQHKLHSSLDRR